MSSPYVAEVEHQIGADHRPQSGRFQLEERNRKFQEQVYLRNCRNASGNACVRRTRLCSLQVGDSRSCSTLMVLFDQVDARRIPHFEDNNTENLTEFRSDQAGHGLQCYTTPDICETEKGYGGGCIEDVGVAIGCAPGQDSCRSVPSPPAVLRAAEPSYYFINKTCTSACERQVASVAVEAISLIRLLGQHL
eukprot:2188252-Rhodomonas_salina.1